MATAAIVPVGMDFEASAKSPDLLDPAIMPAQPDKLDKNDKLIAVTLIAGLKLKMAYRNISCRS